MQAEAPTQKMHVDPPTQRQHADSSTQGRHPDSGQQSTISTHFRKLAYAASNIFGSHWAFIAAVALIVGWAFCGPFFGFSETWQLVINTGTTIITFLMVFLIQATQNRDAKAIHLKLDELIRSSKARNIFADLEDATDEELDVFQKEFQELRRLGQSNKEALMGARKVTAGR